MSRPPSIRHVQGTDCFFLGAFPTPIIVRRCLDIGVAEQFLHGDEIDVVIQHVACDSAMNDVNKDGHSRSPLGRSARRLPTRESVSSYPAGRVKAKPLRGAAQPVTRCV